jgi:hypothetical protein
MPSLVESEHEPRPPERRTQRRGHEPLAVGVRGALIGGAGICVVVVAAVAICYAMFVSLARPPQSTREKLPAPESVRAQVVPVDPNQPERRRELRRQEDRLLGLDPSQDRYEWIDNRDGVARIPIDTAMDIIAEQGVKPTAPQAVEAKP